MYIAATIFGAGVTVVDMIGVLGSQTGEDADGDDDAADDDGDSGEDAVDDHPSVVAHDFRPRSAQKWILRSLNMLRNLVYFSLGFGPVGWFALGRYSQVSATLLWSIPSGLVVMVGARLLRRLLRSELDSQVAGGDLLMERGEITVSVSVGQMGKARIRVGGIYVDRFARAKEPGVSLPVGTTIRVVDVSDECIFVEEEQ